MYTLYMCKSPLIELPNRKVVKQQIRSVNKPVHSTTEKTNQLTFIYIYVEDKTKRQYMSLYSCVISDIKIKQYNRYYNIITRCIYFIYLYRYWDRYQYVYNERACVCVFANSFCL